MAYSFRHCHRCGAELTPNGCPGPCFHMTEWVMINEDARKKKLHGRVPGSVRGRAHFPRSDKDPRPKIVKKKFIKWNQDKREDGEA